MKSGNENRSIPPAAGCCAGQALGCGCAFLASWTAALFLSAVLPALFGSAQGAGSTIDILLTGLVCGSSLAIAAIISFLGGRFFPVIRRKGEG